MLEQTRKVRLAPLICTFILAVIFIFSKGLFNPSKALADETPSYVIDYTNSLSDHSIKLLNTKIINFNNDNNNKIYIGFIVNETKNRAPQYDFKFSTDKTGLVINYYKDTKSIEYDFIEASSDEGMDKPESLNEITSKNEGLLNSIKVSVNTGMTDIVMHTSSTKEYDKQLTKELSNAVSSLKNLKIDYVNRYSTLISIIFICLIILLLIISYIVDEKRNSHSDHNSNNTDSSNIIDTTDSNL